MGQRVVKANRPERIELVERLLLDGESLHSIKKRVAREYGCTQAAVEDDIAVVEDLWAQELKRNIRVRRYYNLARLEALYREAVAAGDYREARAILMDIARLDGTLVSKVALTDSEGEDVELRPEEVFTRVMAIIAAGAEGGNNGAGDDAGGV